STGSPRAASSPAPASPSRVPDGGGHQACSWASGTGAVRAPHPSDRASAASRAPPPRLVSDNPAPWSGPRRPRAQSPERLREPRNVIAGPVVSAAWTVSPSASPSPPSIAMGEPGPQVNTDLRDDLVFRMPSSLAEGGRDQIGRVAAIKSESVAALRWNPHTTGSGRYLYAASAVFSYPCSIWARL